MLPLALNPFGWEEAASHPLGSSVGSGVGSGRVGPVHPPVPGFWGMLSTGLIPLWDDGDTQPSPLMFFQQLHSHLRTPNLLGKDLKSQISLCFSLELHTGMECGALSHVTSRQSPPSSPRSGAEDEAEG